MKYKTCEGRSAANYEAELSAHVADPERLAALRSVALLDTPAEEAFDRLTWLAARFVKAPVSLVSLVDADRQFFKSALGLPEPWNSMRETPLSHSFCQHNRVASQPLLIEDARLHPLFKDNLAIRDLNVIAYLGIPLVTCDGYVLGSFCAIDSQPRDWDEQDIRVIESLAGMVMTEIHLRTEIKGRNEAEEKLKEQNDELRRAYQELEKETAERVAVSEELRERDRMLIHQGRFASMGEMISNIAHQWRQPLNVLALLAQELPLVQREGELTDDYLDENVGNMMDILFQMSETIDNFRNFFSPNKEKVRFNILDAIRKSVSLLDASLKEARINVVLVEGLAPVVEGYPNEYSQVLLNILINARDAFVSNQTSDPIVTIEVGSEGGRSVVTISDNAGGMSEGIIDKIFDPYFTTKGPDRGTGIGLYMSKVIMEKNMEGSLTARNRNGGAEFRIVL